MSEQKKESLFKEQKKARPKIEDVIPEYLGGDTRQSALDFVEYLRENNMQPQWSSANSWKFSYKGKGAGHIRIEKDAWSPSPDNDFTKEFEDFVIKEGLRDFLWANPAYCRPECHRHTCAKRHGKTAETYTGVTRKLFGKEFENMCASGGVRFPYNPDEKMVGYIKKLIDFRRRAIETDTISKIKYVSLKNRISKTEVVVIENETTDNTVTIPAGKYIKDTFNARDFDDLAILADMRTEWVKTWAKENGEKIINSLPVIKVEPAKEGKANPHATPPMYILTPVE